MRLLQLALLLSFMFASPSAVAQPASSADLLKTAYEISGQASTEAEYTLIVKQIERANLETAAPKVQAYGWQLMSWALNRRGEMRWDRMQSPDDADALAAVKDFKRSLELDPNRWRAKQNMAFVHAMAGEMKPAEKLLDEVIAIKPDHANAYFNRAELRYEIGKLAEAVADYSDAIRLEPREADFYTGRAHARFQNGEVAEAVDDYREAYQLDSGNYSRAMNFADALQNIGRWREAADAYAIAIRLETKNLRARLNQAWLLATCPDPSVRDGEQSLQITSGLRDIPNTEEFRYLDTHAAALAETGRFDDALRTAKTGLNIAPSSELGEFQKRLAGYKSNRPYRQSTPKQKKK